VQKIKQKLKENENMMMMQNIGGQLVGLMPVVAACHLIYVFSVVCIVFLFML